MLYLEHKNLYRRVKGDVPEGRYETPMGELRVAREGTDLTVVSYGAMVHTALEATEDIDGASIEVLDLRTLCPLDREGILESVRKTSKVVVLHEATRSCGVGAEVCLADRRGGVRGPRRAGGAGDRARRPDPVLASAGASGAAPGGRREKGVP